ncbi:sigma 54-interacting transcriptional regulator [Clostridium sp. MB40-C1]|uniref:sigma 54-interacting transcriptional regulator n=1 Tax=Clostridium sp. MB40-C1 TaxID=3070996 RepID=UPI0027DF74B8|nr:sigma 54-interacting transcriptional regulator [Clostridium sp. MB40-C1]WMJ80216.1 sigma 54-interacting transcriptional regulator [Clostridium sp. MB40-C1]
MKNFIRLEIITRDRIGMTLDIVAQIYKFNINVHSLEVFPKKVCVKVEEINKDIKQYLSESLYSLEGVISVKEVGLLQQEKNERKILATIDSVDEGIMAINNKLEVEIFNSYCEKIFRCKREDIIGSDINNFLSINAPMITLLKTGEKYDNVEINIKGDGGEGDIHYLTTGRPVKDDNNKTIGVVASIKDIKQAIEIANIVSSTEAGAFNEVIGNSFPMERAKKLCASVAKSNSTILLRGESGTGKEVFAKAIQKLSERKDKNFVTINCAALPDNLIESELFGYEKGSFTGANVLGKEGLFKEADGGTLFLDEIGEVSLVLQAKLLRVLQEGVIRKIGSNKEEKVDVRIIAATNRNLEEMIKREEFREDLYYRLNVIPIFIPPLRERLEDIPNLVSFFINKLNKRLNKNILGAEIEFINALMEYNWPGNVRELENVIERAMNLCFNNLLKLEHLIIDFKGYNKPSVQNFELDGDMKLKDVVEICEKEAIIKALEKYKSCRKAAKVLGVSHTTIINKTKKYNINCKI